MEARHIAILGSYGTKNLGDEAILTGILGLLNTYFPGTRFTVIGPNPEQIISSHNVTAISAKRTRDLRKKLYVFCSADFLIIGGGGLFQDNRKSNWLKGMIATYVSTAILAKIFGCRIALVGVSIGPIFSSSSKVLMSLLCKISTIIVTRDRESMELALCFGADPAKTFLAADLALCLTTAIDTLGRGPSLASRCGCQRDYCVLSLRPTYSRLNKNQPFGIPQKCMDSLVLFISWIMTSMGLDVIFVPFDPDHDMAVGNHIEILVNNSERFHVWREPLCIGDLTQLLAAARVTIGMRLHSLILSFAVGTPVLPIPYDAKVFNFARQIGACDALTPDTLEVERLQREFCNAIQKSNTETSDFANRLTSLRESICTAFRQLSLTMKKKTSRSKDRKPLEARD